MSPLQPQRIQRWYHLSIGRNRGTLREKPGPSRTRAGAAHVW